VDEPIIILCPTCGAECTSEAAFCGACGSALEQPAPRETQAAALPAAASNGPLTADVTIAAAVTSVPETVLPVSATPAPVEAPTPTTDLTPTTDPAPAAAAGASRRCNWCGTESPADAQRCAKCGAMFPTPDTDAAYMAAAEERIRGVQESLEQMRRNWRRRGIGRLFED
jgi:hypothetical protein